jgi:hypothetical protein
MIPEQTETQPPIDFEWYLTGPQGARFVLFPETGFHTPEDVKRARSWLYRNHDVVSIQIRWKSAGDKTEQPMKIPDSAIISELRRQIGENEAYIQELEEKLKGEDVAQNRTLKKELLKETTIASLNKRLTKLLNENIGLRKNISDLVTRLNNPKS